jgi:phosphate transport system substrate-binding protein
VVPILLNEQEGNMLMRKSLLLTATICIAIATHFVVPVLGADTSAKPALRVNGAAMASDQVQKWANAFMQTNPGANVLVIGSSAGKGFEALFEGHADIALASRAISAEEQKKASDKGLVVANKLICYSGMAVMTNPKNTIDELTLEQLRKVFTGEYTNWKQVGGPDAQIRTLTRRVPESGGAVFFMQEVLQNKAYGSTTVFAESWNSIVHVCSAANDLPIGIGPALVTKSQIKLLAIKPDENSPAVKPSEDALKDKSYPIINPIHMFWNSKSEDERIKSFVEYCAREGVGSSAK